MAPQIRKFDWRRDRKAVLSFQREVYERNFPSFTVDKGFLRDYASQLRRAISSWSEQMWVLEADGELCGFVWVALISTLIDPCVGYIKNVYVVPHLRGQGWGKALLSTAEQWSADQGATKAVLDASVCNQEAVGLYSAQGYEIVRHRMEKGLED